MILFDVIFKFCIESASSFLVIFFIFSTLSQEAKILDKIGIFLKNFAAHFNKVSFSNFSSIVN